MPYSVSVASTSGTNPQINHRIESVNSAMFAGQTVTLSVWAKSSVGTGPLAWLTQYPGSTDNWGSATTDQSGTFVATMTIGSWTRYTATFTANALASRGYVIVIYRNVTTTSTTTLYAGVQLEAGSAATSFRRNANSIQGELAACQRYFIASPTTNITYGMSSNVTSGAGYVAYATFPVPMRTAPTTVSLTNGSIISAFPSTPAAAQGITAYGFYEVRVANATSNGYFGGNYTANAEL
jgi:hypothetical protein